MSSNIPTAIVVPDQDHDDAQLPVADDVGAVASSPNSTGFSPVHMKDQAIAQGSGGSYVPVNVKQPVMAVEVPASTTGALDPVKLVSSEIPPDNNKDESVQKIKKAWGKYAGLNLRGVTTEELKERCGGKLCLKSSKYENSTFGGSSLNQIQFDNSVFHNVDFAGAKLDGCSFKNSRFVDCTFENAQLNNCSFDNNAMSGINFTAATLATCSFKCCAISAANFSGAILSDCVFHSAAISNTNFNDAHLEQCNISYARVKASFVRAIIAFTSFQYSALSSTNMTDAVVRQTSFTYSALGDGIYTNASFEECDFTHSATKSAHLPTTARLTNCKGLSSDNRCF